MKHTIGFSGFVFALLMLLMLPAGLQAQKYTVAAGYRGGPASQAITVKVVPVKGYAVEGMYNFQPIGNTATLLVERNRCMIFPALQFYSGIGAHARWNYEPGTTIGGPLTGRMDDVIEGSPAGEMGVGLDVITGVEWKIPLLPVAVSADVKPMLELTPNGSLMYGLDPALGAKIVF